MAKENLTLPPDTAPPPEPPIAEPAGDVTPPEPPPAPEPDEFTQRILTETGSDPAALAQRLAAAERLIGQRDEDAILGKTIREKGFPGAQPAPTAPPDPSAQAAQQQAADIAQIKQELIASEYSIMYDEENLQNPDVQRMIDARAKREYETRQRMFAPVQMLAGIVNKTMAKQALLDEVGNYVPEGLRVDPSAIVGELTSMMGPQFDIIQWSVLPPELQEKFGRLAAFEAAHKRKGPAPTTTPAPQPTQVRNAPAPEPVIRGGAPPAAAASRYATDPRLDIVKTSLMQKFPGQSADWYTQTAADDLEYRDAYAKGGR